MDFPKDQSSGVIKLTKKRPGAAGKDFVVVDSPTQYLETENGKVLDTFRNLEWLLNKFNAQCRYNLMTRRREIVLPNQYLFSDDIENSALTRVQYLAILNGMPIKHLDTNLDYLAQENPYHPIIEMIKNNQWDGVNRLDKFIQTVQTTNNSVSHRLIKTWMIAAIAAAHSATGFVNQGVLVLQGKQDIGKTRWVKSLDPINCDAVKEGAILDPANKDNVTTLAKHWIVELGELDATFRKADIARLKSFITMQADDVRLPYARRHTRMPRRTAYIATVNDNNFLADDTGNRRWWTITVNSINFNHGLDMIQVWSEVYQLWINGALTYLSDDLKISVNEINESHEKVEPFQELLSSRFDWDSTARQELTATQVLIELGYKAPTLSETQRMGNSLQKTKCSFRKINGTTRYSIPYLLIRKF